MLRAGVGDQPAGSGGVDLGEVDVGVDEAE